MFMNLLKYKGKHIRVSDKSLVFRFSAGSLFLLFLAVIMLLNLKSILTTDWKSVSFGTKIVLPDSNSKGSCNNNENLFINLDIVVQIYENLLSNSIRYANSMIDIDISMKKQYLLISVSDDGCGFKDSDIERVTLPFYKSSQDTTTEHLGLGLNICKILCERHGGTLKIANNDKGGACVTAWIKIIDVDEK